MRRHRSAKQNAYLWSQVYAPIAAKTGRSAQDVHDLCCQWFLPQPTLRKLSNWPDGELRTIVRAVPHTSQLTPAEFQKFVDAVRLFAKSCLGVETEDPDYGRFGPVPKDWQRRA
jgi:hypothetical protein